MRIELHKRPIASQTLSYTAPVLALAATVLAGAVMFALMGKPPAVALYTYFIEPLLDPWSRDQVFLKATPLAIIAVGLCICFRSGNWNIGAEGQYLIGGMVGAAVPVLFPDFSSPLLLPIMIVLGMIGGGLYASIPGYLKAKFGTNEILTSLMLVYVAQQFVDWIVRGPWRDPQGMGFPGTKRFDDSGVLPNLIGTWDTHWGAVFAIIAAIAAWFMLSRTLKGFEIAVLGQSARAGQFAGFSARSMTIFAFALSGALAGLAGISEVSGSVEKLDDKLSLGYGFTAIIVAFLGRLNPIGCIFAALLLALSSIGGESAQIALGISDRATRVFQGMLLFFVLAADTLIHYRIRLVGRTQVAQERAL